MASPINPLSHPLAQIQGFPSYGANLISAGGGDTGGGDTTTTTTTAPPVISGNPVIAGYQLLKTAVSTSLVGDIFSSRIVLFILGIICIIAGLYLLKPGPVTTIIQAPFKAAKKGVEVAGAAATAAG
jgi:hypothetical protein